MTRNCAHRSAGRSSMALCPPGQAPHKLSKHNFAYAVFAHRSKPQPPQTKTKIKTGSGPRTIASRQEFGSGGTVLDEQSWPDGSTGNRAVGCGPLQNGAKLRGDRWSKQSCAVYLTRASSVRAGTGFSRHAGGTTPCKDDGEQPWQMAAQDCELWARVDMYSSCSFHASSPLPFILAPYSRSAQPRQPS